MAAPAHVDSGALAYNQSIVTLAASMGVEPGLIFNPNRELRACLVEVPEHIIVLDPIASPALADHHGPGDENSSYWVKVSSADELLKCCEDSSHLKNYDRLLHVYLLPSIPIDDVNTIDDWEAEEDCSNVRIYVMNRVQTLCKIDALSVLGSIRQSIKDTKDMIEKMSIELRLLANEHDKDADRLKKPHVAYVAMRDSKVPVPQDQLTTVRDEAIIACRPLIVARVSGVSLNNAADTTRRLVNFMSSKVLQIDDILKSLTLMGCGHPADDFQDLQIGQQEDGVNQGQDPQE